MVKISDLKVGQVLKNEFDNLTRDLLKQYAKASGDTNPIHVNDAVAEAAGLKGVIAHGLFSFGFISKLFEDFLEHGKYGKIIEFDIKMVGMVRVGDRLITEAIVSEITEKRVLFNIKQTTITKINLKNKNGEIIKQFEAGERGYVSEKDINRELIHEKEIDNQTLVYRERVSIKGTSLVQILD